jgi:hypothetical protein
MSADRSLVERLRAMANRSDRPAQNLLPWQRTLVYEAADRIEDFEAERLGRIESSDGPHDPRCEKYPHPHALSCYDANGGYQNQHLSSLPTERAEE